MRGNAKSIEKTGPPSPQPSPASGRGGNLKTIPKRSSMANLTLEVLTETFAICRLGADQPIPVWATGNVVAITRTPNELSIVCPQAQVPAAIQCEPDWRCLRVADQLDFAMVGVIASLTRTLASANISVFVISTFETDYLLVKEADLHAAVESLTSDGHSIHDETR